jgi:hypothetical protein
VMGWEVPLVTKLQLSNLSAEAPASHEIASWKLCGETDKLLDELLHHLRDSCRNGDFGVGFLVCGRAFNIDQ